MFIFIFVLLISQSEGLDLHCVAVIVNEAFRMALRLDLVLLQVLLTHYRTCVLHSFLIQSNEGYSSQ